MRKPLTSMRWARFGEFTLDLRAGELHNATRVIRLQQKPLEFLCLLLEHSGEVVSPEQIRRSLWPNDVVVDFEHGIATALKKVRRALGDDAANPRYIETLVRRGYRWKGTVEWLESAGQTSVLTPRVVDSIAVLPFLNLSPDSIQNYVSDGLAEEILNALSRVPGLRVVARSSSFAFRSEPHDVRRIGGALNTAAVLEGTLRYSGGRIHVAVQLIDTHDGSRLWSEDYDRAMSDVFAVQEEISQSIAARLKLKLSDDSSGARNVPSNVEAHHAYLEGRHHLLSLTVPGLERSRACHERAVELDSSYALAYVGLAENYYISALYLNARPRDVLPLALSAAERAVRLDPDCAEGYSIRGALRAVWEYDWKSAGEDLTRALDLNPRLGSALHRRASWCARSHENALADIRKALEIDSLGVFPRSAEPYYLCRVGRNEEAIQEARKVMELFPWYWFGYFVASVALSVGGLYQEAGEALRSGLSMDPQNTLLLAMCGLAYSRMGDGAEARRILEQLEALGASKYISPAAVAIASFAAGETDHAYDWLHRGIEERDPMVITLSKSPMFSAVDRHPRYLDLLQKMNIRPQSPPDTTSAQKR